LHYAFGVDQQLFRGATLSVNYIRADGVHQFHSINANSPIGTDAHGDLIYPIPPTNGVPVVRDTYESGGVYRQNQLIANVNIRPKPLFSISGYGMLNFANGDSSGITSFPSADFYNIGKDYGRTTFDVRYRLFLFGNLNLPHAVTVSPMVILSAGTPYNITTGTVNSSGQFNSRPAFGAANASAPGTPGSNTIAGCGSFVPVSGNASPIPINLCTGPSQFTANVRLNKVFGFGPETGARAQGQGQGGGNRGGPGGPGAPGGPGGPGGGRGGPGGGGGGGRGGPGGGPGGGFGGGGGTGRRYNLSFGVQVLNLFNNEDVSTPNGTLTSQNFGRSTQLAGRPFTTPSALRQVFLQTSFTF
jgi:hypothetical protein